MKTAINILIFISGFAMVFLMFAFYKWGIDPSFWCPGDRFGVAFIGSCVGAMLVLAKQMEL